MQTRNFERVLANFALLLVPATVVGKALVITQPEPNCCRMWTDTSFNGEFTDYCYDVQELGKNGQKTELTGLTGMKESYWCGQNVSYSFCDGMTDDCSG